MGDVLVPTTTTGTAIATDAGMRDGLTENVQLVRADHTLLKTYSASIVAAAGVAGIFLLLGGSATTTVKLRRLMLSGTAGTGAFFDFTVVKYTSAASGGTQGTAPTIAQLDSNNGAATATVALYTAAPTAGTNAGIVTARKLLLSATGTVTFVAPPHDVSYSVEDEQCPTLRGTAQQLGLVLSAAPATGSIDATIWWTEETNSF